ncbi:hypothetical protein AAEX37_01950 [Oligella sp. MSHR50489EDL]|uniref:phage baseplate protein n=1 Tax=Oligella sp. MSHR50489EDL TaxID=3139409 RepID=UPI003D81A957
MIGMPSLPDRYGLISSGTDALISLGGAAIIDAFFSNVWGVVNEYGVPILLADSVLSIKHSDASAISNAPVEKGSFASYNKVKEPYKTTIRMSKGTHGTLGRGAFLAQLKALSDSTLLHHVITPEYVYTNANIVGYDFSREAKDGFQLVKVNLHLEEVIEVEAQYDIEELANPEDAPTQETPEGKVEYDASALKGIVDKVKEWW